VGQNFLVPIRQFRSFGNSFYQRLRTVVNSQKKFNLSVKNEDLAFSLSVPVSRRGPSPMAMELGKSRIEIVGEMPWGAHFCIFHETLQDLLDIPAPVHPKAHGGHGKACARPTGARIRCGMGSEHDLSGRSIDEIAERGVSLERGLLPDPEVRQKVWNLIGRADGKWEVHRGLLKDFFIAPSSTSG
jgi:hypothetical protein